MKIVLKYIATVISSKQRFKRRHIVSLTSQQPRGTTQDDYGITTETKQTQTTQKTK